MCPGCRILFDLINAIYLEDVNVTNVQAVTCVVLCVLIIFDLCLDLWKVSCEASSKVTSAVPAVSREDWLLKEVIVS